MKTRFWQITAGLLVVCLATVSGFSQESASDSRNPASFLDIKEQKATLEYPVAGNTNQMVVTGYHLRRIEMFNSDGESVYTWAPRKKQPYGKVTLNIGNMPGDVYNVKVEYAHKKSSTFVIRNDGQVF